MSLGVGAPRLPSDSGRADSGRRIRALGFAIMWAVGDRRPFPRLAEDKKPGAIRCGYFRAAPYRSAPLNAVAVSAFSWPCRRRGAW